MQFCRLSLGFLETKYLLKFSSCSPYPLSFFFPFLFFPPSFCWICSHKICVSFNGPHLILCQRIKAIDNVCFSPAPRPLLCHASPSARSTPAHMLVLLSHPWWYSHSSLPTTAPLLSSIKESRRQTGTSCPLAVLSIPERSPGFGLGIYEVHVSGTEIRNKQESLIFGYMYLQGND